MARPNSINSIDNNKEEPNSGELNKNKNRVGHKYEGFSLAIGHKSKLENKTK